MFVSGKLSRIMDSTGTDIETEIDLSPAFTGQRIEGSRV
jgi:hypothetical protein